MTERGTAMEWVKGMPCRVVEHDDATRHPKPGGKVLPATVTSVAGLYVSAQLDPGHPLSAKPVQFWASSGWTAWTGSFRWRLMPAEDAAAAAGEGNGNA